MEEFLISALSVAGVSALASAGAALYAMYLTRSSNKSSKIASEDLMKQIVEIQRNNRDNTITVSVSEAPDTASLVADGSIRSKIGRIRSGPDREEGQNEVDNAEQVDR